MPRFSGAWELVFGDVVAEPAACGRSCPRYRRGRAEPRARAYGQAGVQRLRLLSVAAVPEMRIGWVGAMGQMQWTPEVWA